MCRFYFCGEVSVVKYSSVCVCGGVCGGWGGHLCGSKPSLPFISVVVFIYVLLTYNEYARDGAHIEMRSQYLIVLWLMI